jgi:hypothetical protein
MRGRLTFFTILIIATVVSMPQTKKMFLREEQTVIVDGQAEVWRLEWHNSPQAACDPADPNWFTCPCSGFAFGEKGELDLVRKVAGKKDERFSLTHFFAGNYASSSLAILPKRQALDSDIERKDSIDFEESLKYRPIVRIMNFADYDHDGRAAEFILQINADPCGHRQTIAVGISHNNPYLHVFGTVLHPDIPLILENPSCWQALLESKGDTIVTELACWDHGSEEESLIQLHTSSLGIEATRLIYKCDDNSKEKKLLKREIF